MRRQSATTVAHCESPLYSPLADWGCEEHGRQSAGRQATRAPEVRQAPLSIDIASSATRGRWRRHLALLYRASVSSRRRVCERLAPARLGARRTPARGRHRMLIRVGDEPDPPSGFATTDLVASRNNAKITNDQRRNRRPSVSETPPPNQPETCYGRVNGQYGSVEKTREAETCRDAASASVGSRN